MKAAWYRLLFLSLQVNLMIAACVPVYAEEAMQPNIVFILADDLGYADLSVFGSRQIHTPNVDSLAQDGLKLTNAYANSPVCSPTRFSLMTGRYQYRFRSGLEEPIPSTGSRKLEFGLDPSQPTLASRLSSVGYTTALVGKWHLGELPKFGPLLSGYQSFFGIYGGAVDYFTHQVDGQEALYDGQTIVNVKGYITDLFGDRAVALIDDWGRSSVSPFFLSLHFTAPHFPWEGPNDEEVSRNLKSIGHYDGGSRDVYSSMVENLDKNVGRVLRALDRNAFTDNTIVIFTSDNGGERYSDVWPLRGRKGELLEGGIRVPALIRWPKHIAEGQVSPIVTITMDWTASLLDAAGIKLSPELSLDGRSLWNEFASVNEPTQPLYWRFVGRRQAAVREGNWKWLRIGNDEFLFDLSRDTSENANLSMQHPQILRRLRSLWTDWDRSMLSAPKDLPGYCIYPHKIAGAGEAGRESRCGEVVTRELD